MESGAGHRLLVILGKNCAGEVVRDVDRPAYCCLMIEQRHHVDYAVQAALVEVEVGVVVGSAYSPCREPDCWVPGEDRRALG